MNTRPITEISIVKQATINLLPLPDLVLAEIKDYLFCEKPLNPSLKEEYIKHDYRGLIRLIETYNYTDEEASEVINMYEPYEDGYIPEVEHIEVILSYFPKSTITEETMNAIIKCYPHELDYINRLRNK